LKLLLQALEIASGLVELPLALQVQKSRRKPYALMDRVLAIEVDPDAFPSVCEHVQ